MKVRTGVKGGGAQTRTQDGYREKNPEPRTCRCDC